MIIPSEQAKLFFMKVISIKVGRCLLLLTLALASLLYFLSPFQTALERAEVVKANSDISSISQSLTTYKDLHGFLPSTSQGLEALAAKPSGNPMPKDWLRLMVKVPVDPWGNAYQYALPGEHHPNSFDLYSTGGPRGKVIGNW